MNVQGIGEKSFVKLRSQLKFGDASVPAAQHGYAARIVIQYAGRKVIHRRGVHSTSVQRQPGFSRPPSRVASACGSSCPWS